MVLVIGYGNRLCGDDGVGQFVADRLFDTTDSNQVEIITRHQLTPELVEPISRADLVIFIDAQAGSPAGKISVTEVASQTEPAPFSHNMTPAALLSGACLLYGKCPDAVLYSVTAQDFHYGDQFSPPVLAALPELIRRIEERIAQCTNTASSSHS